MINTYLIFALVLFVVWVVFARIVETPVIKEYTKAIGKSEKTVKLSEGELEAAKLLSIIDKAGKEQHPDDYLGIKEGKEFKFYMKEAYDHNALSMLVCMAHELGCEIVLRRVSDKDIEDEHNRGDVFWEYLCDEKERFFKDWEPEYRNFRKTKV